MSTVSQNKMFRKVYGIKSLTKKNKKFLVPIWPLSCKENVGTLVKVLYEIKNLTEFILEDYIEKRYPGLIDEYCEDIQKYYLSLFDYSKLFKSNERI